MSLSGWVWRLVIHEVNFIFISAHWHFPGTPSSAASSNKQCWEWERKKEKKNEKRRRHVLIERLRGSRQSLSKDAVKRRVNSNSSTKSREEGKERGVAWGDVCPLCKERFGGSVQSCKKNILPLQSQEEVMSWRLGSNHIIEELPWKLCMTSTGHLKWIQATSQSKWTRIIVE